MANLTQPTSTKSGESRELQMYLRLLEYNVDDLNEMINTYNANIENANHNKQSNLKTLASTSNNLTALLKETITVLSACVDGLDDN